MSSCNELHGTSTSATAINIFGLLHSQKLGACARSQVSAVAHHVATLHMMF